MRRLTPMANTGRVLHRVLLCLLSHLAHGIVGALDATPQASYHVCHGDTDITRSCLFENLYYHIPTATYVYFEQPDEPPSIKSFGQFHQHTTFAVPKNETEAYYVTQDFIKLRWPQGDTPFNLKSSRGAPPPASTVRRVVGISLLWHFNLLSGYSYGHCLLNDWLPMHLTLSNHYHPLPATLNVFDLYNLHQSDKSKEKWRFPTVCAHYIGNYVNGSIINFAEFVDHTFNETFQQWIHFDEVVVGDGGLIATGNDLLIYRHTPLQMPSPLYTSHNWFQLRAATLQRNQIDQHTLVPERQHILVRTYGPHERRKVVDTDHVIQQLRQHFPDATVSGHDLQHLSPSEQMRLLSNTTVFISMQGSASFRHVFLPIGAVFIIVGNPAHSSVIKVDDFQYTPFHEVAKFFPLAYVRQYRYSVLATNLSEYIIKGDTNYKDLSERKWSYYSADVVMNLARLVPLVKRAFADVRDARQFHLRHTH